MLAWMIKHPVAIWSIAWGITGIGLQLADVFSEPPRGPRWIGVITGVVAWGVAGAVTFHGNHLRRGAVIWALAYVAAFGLAASLGSWFEHNQYGPYSSAGFIGMLLGWAAGAALGALPSVYTMSAPGRRARALPMALAWGLAFFVGGYVALVAALLLGQAAKGAVDFTGHPRAGLMVGWALGCALGGLLTAAMGLAVQRRLVGPSPDVPAR
jgi:hypothetical protein